MRADATRPLRPLPRALAEKAAAELNENEAEVEYYLGALRAWVVAQPHIRARTCDQFLIAFLRSAKYSLERAKQLLENFYVLRTMAPEVFSNRDPNDPKIEMIMDSGALLYLPTPLAPDGPRVVMCRPKCFDMDKYSIPDVCKVAVMAIDVLLYLDDNALVAGYVVIMDLGDIPKAVVRSFDPNFIRRMTILGNKMSLTRMKGFHFLNVPSLFEKGFNMVKGVINEKLRNRFYVHGKNYEALYEHVPREILPKEYGGDLDEKIVLDIYRQLVQNNKEFIEEESTYGVVQGYKRPQGCKELSDENIFGVEGSFRKLNFD